jgi:hypothetical protein
MESPNRRCRGYVNRRPMINTHLNNMPGPRSRLGVISAATVTMYVNG